MTGARAWMRFGCAIALGSSACSDGVGPTERTTQLVFVGSGSQAPSAGAPLLYDIYRVRADGTGLENVTHSPSDYADLDVTPDAGTVVFAAELPKGGTWTSSTDCPRRIWRMAPDGSQLRPVTSGPACSSNPRVSRADTRVAYQRDNEIFVANLDGTGETQATSTLPPLDASACGTSLRPTVRLTGWFDRDHLSFYRQACGVGRTYYTVGTHGEELRVIDTTAGPTNAYLSPDRTRIAFAMNGQLWVRNVDGTGQRALAAARPNGTVGYFVEPNPWSPDGKSVVFTGEGGQLSAASTEGGAVRTLRTTANVQFNGWSPDGSLLAWSDFNASLSDVVVTRADGTGLVRLTNGTSINRFAVWTITP